MSTLSLCMIVKNEEQFIEQCLQSVKGLVDEIVIVDTGSTDKTKEIASRFTRRIYDFVWCDDFSAARNVSLNHATGDWILVLDADERVAIQDHSMIKHLISSVSVDTRGFLLTQRNYFKTREDLQLGTVKDFNITAGGAELDFVSTKGDTYDESKGNACWLPSQIVRLFRRSDKVVFSGRVHEDVSLSLNGKIIPAAVPIHHFGKLNVESWRKKSALYAVLGKKKAEEQQDYYAYYELGRQHLASLNGKSPTENQQNADVCNENSKDESLLLDQAREALEKSILLKSDFWLSWFNLGGVHLLRNDLEYARICLEKALELHKSPQIYLNLGVVYCKQKRYGEAIDVFIQGIQQNPSRAELYKNLGLCYLETGNQREAVPVLKMAIQLNSEYAKQFTFG